MWDTTIHILAHRGKRSWTIQDPGFNKGWIDRFMRDGGFTIRAHENNCWTTFASAVQSSTLYGIMQNNCVSALASGVIVVMRKRFPHGILKHIQDAINMFSPTLATFSNSNAKPLDLLRAIFPVSQVPYPPYFYHISTIFQPYFNHTSFLLAICRQDRAGVSTCYYCLSIVS